VQIATLIGTPTADCVQVQYDSWRTLGADRGPGRRPLFLSGPFQHTISDTGVVLIT
jgi:hypothetical protein